MAPVHNQHLHGHHLSRPPSPSSVHSSTSAIFERDIELPAVASLSINPQQTQTLAHKQSRLHLTHGSALDHTVPSVLDDAVQALAANDGSVQSLEIEAPTAAGVPMARQASAGPLATSRTLSSGPPGPASRSPSPPSAASSSIASPASPPTLSQLSTQISTGNISSGGPSPTSVASSGSLPPFFGRPPIAKPPSSGAHVPTKADMPIPDEVSDKYTVACHFNASSRAELGLIIQSSHATSISPPTLTPTPSFQPHLTPSKDKRRISFISYNDLLLSVPTSVTPLEDITSGTLSPDHLPGTVSPQVTMGRSPVIPSSSSPTAALSPLPSSVEHRPSIPRGLGLEGEWEREGLGKGLEQRLEDLVKDGRS